MLDRLADELIDAIAQDLLDRTALEETASWNGAAAVAFQRDLLASTLVARRIGRVAQARVNRIEVIHQGSNRTRRRLASLEARFVADGEVRRPVDLLVALGPPAIGGGSDLSRALGWIDPVELIAPALSRIEHLPLTTRLASVRRLRVGLGSRALFAFIPSAAEVRIDGWCHDQLPPVVDPDTGLLRGLLNLRRLCVDASAYNPNGVQRDDTMQLGDVLKAARRLVQLTVIDMELFEFQAMFTERTVDSLRRLDVSMRFDRTHYSGPIDPFAVVACIPPTITDFGVSVTPIQTFQADSELAAVAFGAFVWALVCRCDRGEMALQRVRIRLHGQAGREIGALSASFARLGIELICDLDRASSRAGAS